MARVGDGISTNGTVTGAGWPKNTFDTLWVRDNVPNSHEPSSTTLHKELINDGLAYALYITRVLGLNPIGTYPSLQARLDPYIPSNPGDPNHLVGPAGEKMSVNAITFTGGLYGHGYADIKLNGSSTRRLDFGDAADASVAGTFAGLSPRLDAYIPLNPGEPNPWVASTGEKFTIVGVSLTGGLFGSGYVDLKINGTTSQRFSFSGAGAAIGSAIVSYTPTAANSVTRTLNAHLADMVNVKSFGAVGNNSTNDATSILNANLAAGNKIVYFPAGDYVISSTMSLNAISLGYNTQLKPGAGVTLSVGSIDAPPDTQIFGGSGSVQVTSKQPVYAKWWGAKGDGTTNDLAAIQAAVASSASTVRLMGGTFLAGTGTLSGQIEFARGAILKVIAGNTITFANQWAAGYYPIFDANEVTSGTIRVVNGTGIILHPIHWGAIADGATDCRLPLQATFNLCQSLGAIGNISGGVTQLGSGTYLTSGTLTFAVQGGILRGEGKRGSFIVGNFASGDILKVGLPGSDPGLVTYLYRLQDFSIDSSVVKTSGFGIHFENIVLCNAQNMAIGSRFPNNLFSGIYLDGLNGFTIDSFEAYGRDTGVAIRGKTSPNLGAGATFTKGNINECSIGLHVGGLFGGVIIDETDLSLNATNLFISQNLQPVPAAQQIFLGPKCFFDSATAGPGIRIDDPGGWNLFLSGTWIASNRGGGIVINNGTSLARLVYCGGTVYNNTGPGIYANTSVPRIFVDGVSFALNTGMALESGAVNPNFIIGNNDYYLNGGTIGANITGVVMTRSLRVSKPSGTLLEPGVSMPHTGNTIITANGLTPLTVCLNTTNGTLIDLAKDGISQGSISVNGTTVAYNTFTGSHFAQWGTGCEPDEEPLPGTLLSTVDEPYERWYFDEDRVRADSDGAILMSKPQLVKVRITDMSDDQRIYGVYAGRDDHGDISVYGLGTAMVRVIGPVTGGDLLTASDTPGVAERQDGNIITSSTLGKASRGDNETGERLLPCVLYVG